MRDQGLDWQTAPPVHVLNFLVLGSEKDAKSIEVIFFYYFVHDMCTHTYCISDFSAKRQKFVYPSILMHAYYTVHCGVEDMSVNRWAFCCRVDQGQGLLMLRPGFALADLFHCPVLCTLTLIIFLNLGM